MYELMYLANFLLVVVMACLSGRISCEQIHLVNPSVTSFSEFYPFDASEYLTTNAEVVTITDGENEFHNHIGYRTTRRFTHRFSLSHKYQLILFFGPSNTGEMDGLPQGPHGFNFRVTIMFILAAQFDPTEQKWQPWIRTLRIHDALIAFMSVVGEEWRTHWICPVVCGESGLVQSGSPPEEEEDTLDSHLRIDYRETPVAHPISWGDTCASEAAIRKPGGCYPDEHLHETVMTFFNFSIVPVPREHSEKGYFFGNLRGSKEFPLFITQFAYSQDRIAWWEGLPFIKFFEDYLLLYCENELQFRESNAHWIAPFGLDVWLAIAGVAISSILVLLASDQWNFVSLVDNSVFVVGIMLMKDFQTRCQQNSQFSLILPISLSMGSFLFQVRYESDFTSRVIAPPHHHVAQTVRELIIEMGFKLYFPVDNIEQLKGYSTEEFNSGLNRSGIDLAADLSRWIQPNGRPGAGRDGSFRNRSLNIATDFPRTMLDWWPRWLQNRTALSDGSTKFCHGVPETFFRRIWSLAVRGYGHHRVILLMRKMRDNGLPDYWLMLDSLHVMIKHLHSLPAHVAFPEVGPEQGKLKGKLYDVFAVGVVGLATALGMFVLEIMIVMVSGFGRKVWRVVDWWWGDDGSELRCSICCCGT